MFHFQYIYWVIGNFPMIKPRILSSLSGVSSSLSPSLPFVCPVEGRLFSCGEEENRRWKMSYWLQNRVHEWVSEAKKDRMIVGVSTMTHQQHNNNLMSDCTNTCTHSNKILLIEPFSTNGDITSSLCICCLRLDWKVSQNMCEAAKFTGLQVHTSVRQNIIWGDEKI